MEVQIIFIIINLIVILCKDVSENERITRAAFVQRLLNKNKYLEGKIKLAGGSKEYEGNVYIYHAGRWGAVCDDSWDAQAAKVVCRFFNKTGVPTHGGQFGEATEKYWMDDVVCEGDENSITQCIFAGWGSSDCQNSEIAGVICNDDTQNIIPVIVKKDVERQIHEVIDLKKTSLRLVGGRNSKEGRIEIYHNGIWGSLCPDGWTLYEASAVCRHLALGFAEQALQTDYFGSSRVILSGVHCEGNESNLFMCKHRELGQVYCPGDAGHVAAVVCTQNLADLYLDSSAIAKSAHLHDVPMYQLQCAMEENCLSKSAYEVQKTNPNWQFETRRLLRFTASSLNIGNAEFRPYLPKHLWQWHLCHMYYSYIHAWATNLSIAATSHVKLPTMITIVERLIPNSLEGRWNNKSQPKQKTYCYFLHIEYVSMETVVAVLHNSNGYKIFCLITKPHYHSMEVFATFDILDTTGRRVAEGHKASFCLEDNTCLPGVEKKYSCKNYGDQGVSVNCSDIYLYSIDCQWVDVTDVEPGDYTFKVAVNPHARVAEQSFHNNAASCVLRLTDTYAFVHSCNMQRP